MYLATPEISFHLLALFAIAAIANPTAFVTYAGMCWETAVLRYADIQYTSVQSEATTSTFSFVSALDVIANQPWHEINIARAVPTVTNRALDTENQPNPMSAGKTNLNLYLYLYLFILINTRAS